MLKLWSEMDKEEKEKVLENVDRLALILKGAIRSDFLAVNTDAI